MNQFEGLGTAVMVGVSLAGLGRCDEAEGDLAAATAHYEDALALGRRLGEPSVTASSLEGLSRLALVRGDIDQSGRLVHEATEVRERFHRPAPPHERRDLVTATTSQAPRRADDF